MQTIKQAALTALLIAAVASAAPVKKSKDSKKHGGAPAVEELWHQPKDIRSENLFYGIGGKQHEPHGSFAWVKEDLNGSNPKFDVKDEDGVTWRVKLGAEARPEVAVTRILWSVGYFTDEDYFLPDLKVDDVPLQTKRLAKWRSDDGTFPNARLKRRLGDAKHEGTWKWKRNPFTGTRELNGLRVMMALLNSWDVKDENNAYYDEGDGSDAKRIYLISDLGAALGSAGLERTHEKSKDNLDMFRRSRFIKSITPTAVNFETPRRPVIVAWVNPKEYIARMRLEWVGRNIPRQDARWMGSVLAQLSRDQIGDAFRAAGYSTDEVSGFTDVLEDRIAQLNRL